MTFASFSHTIPSVRFYYNDRESFVAPSWQCESGTLYHLKAPNGCGKSSYLKILVKLLHSVQPLYLGHDLGLNADMSLSWHQKVYKFKKGAHEKILSENTVLSLSQGHQKMLALCLHLGKSPLWLLDEPFNALDASNTEQLWGKIDAHQNDGGSVVLTDHLQSENLLSLRKSYPIFLDVREHA